MKVFVVPKQTAYTCPAANRMNISFLESGSLDEGVVLEVQVDRDQAHGLIRELSAFCEREGHPLYQKK